MTSPVQARTVPASLLEFTSPSHVLATLPLSRLARGTTLVVCALFGAGLTALGLIPVDKVVSGRGAVALPNGTIVVQPFDTSIVRAVHVQPGQVVKKGDVLAQLDPTFAGSDFVAQKELVASLQAQIERLQAEVAGRPYAPSATTDPLRVQQAALLSEQLAQHQATLDQFDAQISALQTQIDQAAANVLASTQRLAIATQVAGKREELQRLQVGSVLSSLSANDERLQVQQTLDAAKDAVASGQRDLQAKQSARAAYDQGWRAHVGSELTAMQVRLASATDSLAKATLRQGLVSLRADVDATVLSVANVSIGSVLQSGAQLITLVPSGSLLEVDAAISGRDIGFVRVGQPVAVKFDTLPFAQYGTAQGTVRVVSPSTFTPRTDPAGAAMAGASSGEPYYRLRISLEQVGLHDTPPGFQLLPGMPLSADVMIGRRTVLQYLFMRVLTPVEDGMREP